MRLCICCRHQFPTPQKEINSSGIPSWQRSANGEGEETPSEENT